MFNLAILIALVQYHHNLVSGELLAAAGGDDGAFGNGTDDVIIKAYTHFGKGGGQTYLTDEVAKTPHMAPFKNLNAKTYHLFLILIFPGRTANMLLEVFPKERGVGKGKHIANLLHAVVARPQ